MLKIAYYGAYDGSMNMPAHEAIDAYIKEKGLTHYGNVIEEYVTDPMAEKDTTKWLTNIYYMVK
jgi:effector-binding domain-containing protein